MNRIEKVFSPIHLVSWLVVLLLFSWIFQSEGHSKWPLLAGGLLLGSAGVFYSHYYLLSRFWSRRQFPFYLLGLVLLLLLGPFPFLTLEYGELAELSNFLDHYFTTLLSVVLFWVVISGFVRAIQNWFSNALRREQLEKQAAQAELTYLKAQLNPHFLFNTLHNIHTLAYLQSPLTPDAILRLASLMRYMLHESNTSLVPLSQELNYLQDFISLQQLRYSQNPVARVEVEGDTNACYLPPLLLIPLLENAYKHSPTHLQVHDIHISVLVKEASLTFRLRNPVDTAPPAAAPEPGGIGLANVRKRLRLLYPDQHRLDVASGTDYFEVVLRLESLPAHEPTAHLLYHR
ncbi:sensor histidine kinase [Hymenobacter arizonensis]|uniref:Histidine kinase n=1 Tax=Hymenobacter arizonensis TaxID=1227077 RepID=A0A1I6BIW0_HYMAR|nr:sensor histidine kinase [Hymenobacter arizonensis]SFQ80863.1 Histidine kinase [Hymenobacter arizonensis]